jgi:hypothetical protein
VASRWLPSSIVVIIGGETTSERDDRLCLVVGSYY